MDNNKNTPSNGNVDDNSKQEQKALLGKCPHCGGNIVWGMYGAYCKDKCGMRLGNVYGRKLLDDQVRKLLADGEIYLEDMVNKDGKHYSAKFIANGIEEYSYINTEGQPVTGLYRYKYKLEFTSEDKKNREKKNAAGTCQKEKKEIKRPRPNPPKTSAMLNPPLNINPMILGSLRPLTPLKDKGEEENNNPANVPADNGPVNDLQPEKVSKPSLFKRIKAAVSGLFSGVCGSKNKDKT